MLEEGVRAMPCVTSYHPPGLDDGGLAPGTRFKKWMYDHQPISNTVRVTKLGDNDMRVETEVIAFYYKRPPGPKVREKKRRKSGKYESAEISISYNYMFSVALSL